MLPVESSTAIDIGVSGTLKLALWTWAIPGAAEARAGARATRSAAAQSAAKARLTTPRLLRLTLLSLSFDV